MTQNGDLIMSSQPYNNYRPLDAQLIKDVENVLSKLNMSQTIAIELFFNEIARTGKLPFEIEIPNAETLNAMREKDYKSFNSIEDLMKDLND